MASYEFEKQVGPIIGHASDGEARRRKLMLENATKIREEEMFQPVPLSDGFVLASRVDIVEGKKVIRGVTNMDAIHNHKKLIRQLTHATRVLKFGGGYFAHMNHLRLVYSEFPREDHGLQYEADIEQKDPQNWRSAQRLSMTPVQDKLLELFMSGKEKSALGTFVYLSIVWMYVEIFFSPACPLKDRITLASTVTNFLAIWRQFKNRGLGWACP